MDPAMRRVPEPELMDLEDEAEAYAAADFSEVNAALVGRLLRLAGEREAADVVDLGCGPADIPIRLLEARPGWRVVATDGARAMLDLARQSIQQAGLSNNITLLQADAQATGLAGSSFDLVMHNSLLHHVRDPLDVWNEMRRLARPGALIHVCDLARPASADDARRLVEQHAAEEGSLLKEEYYRSLLSAYTPEEVRQQLREVDWHTLQVHMVSDRHFDVCGPA